MERNLLEHILEITRHMAEMRTITPLLNYVMDEAIKLVGAERGYIVLVQSDSSLNFRVKRGRNGEELTEGADQISKTVLDKVVGSHQPIVLQDAMEDPQFKEANSVVKLRLRSIMCVPLILQGNSIGAIYVENRLIRGRFRDGDIVPLIFFANQVAVYIKNAGLFQALQKTNEALELRVEERTSELTRANTLLKQEISERLRANEELQKKNDQLEKALAQVKLLSGLLPICANCKKVRDDEGYWQDVVIYVRTHSEAEFSHGICPDCMSELYPDYYRKPDAGRE